MNPQDLRIVLRHELFPLRRTGRHSTGCATLAHRGRGRLRGRPAPSAPIRVDTSRLPSDAEFTGTAAELSAAYDRAWLFARFVADRYGAPALRLLYLRAAGVGMPTRRPRCARRARHRRRRCARPVARVGALMPTRVLLVTNDFPPRRGGIQSYLENLVTRLAEAGGHRIAVYAPQWKGAEEYDARAAGFDIVRHPGSLMLPVPTVERRMRGLIREHDAEVVWFGGGAAGAPGPAARRPAHTGCSPAPTGTRSVVDAAGARSALRRIGEGTDVLTYISRHTRSRIRRGVRATRRIRTSAARRRPGYLPA